MVQCKMKFIECSLLSNDVYPSMRRLSYLLLILTIAYLLCSCNLFGGVNSVDSSQYITEKSESGDEQDVTEEQGNGNGVGFSPESVPAYLGNPSVEINGNAPYFRDSELTATAFKRFPDLDELGRCGVVTACLGPETMPVAARESIGMIKPSGWHLEKYEGIDGNYLYNRCHLIGYQLCGENANELNLITGTRYMNTEGMEPYESDTAYYIRRTGNHVLYRVTPVFHGDDLVATGVLMEARSVEDDDFAFCVFCYNVQPGIEIDYATGDGSPAVQDDRSPEAAGRDEEKQTAESDHTKSDAVRSEEENLQDVQADDRSSDTTQTDAWNSDNVQSEDRSSQDVQTDDKNSDKTEGENSNNAPSGEAVKEGDSAESPDYILNTSSQKFHKPDCDSVESMAEHNKKAFYGTRDEAIAQGYDPCKRCNP